MASRYGLRTAPRSVLPRMFAAVAAMAAPTTGAGAATAQPAPDKVYAAFFLGQGGYMFSWGVSRLEQEARRLGIRTQVYEYSDVNAAWADIARRRKEGYRIALVGYSLGNTTATYIQQHVSVDLLLAIAESSLGQNHPVRKQSTRRAVLWWGPDTLSNAGTRDGFDVTNYVDNTHLLMDVDPRVVDGVLAELRAFATRSTPGRRPVRTIPGRRVEAPVRPKTAEDNRTAAGAKPAVEGAPPAAARDDARSDAACSQCPGVASGGGAAPTNPVR